MPANLVFRRKIWGARDNGIPLRSTPEWLKDDKFNFKPWDIGYLGAGTLG